MSKKRNHSRKKQRSAKDGRCSDKKTANQDVSKEPESYVDEVRDLENREASLQQVLIASALLFAAALVVYLHSVSFDFIYDDHKLIVRPAAPQSLSEALHVFAERHWDNLPYYRPIARFTMVTQMALHGDHPGPFHAFNVVLMGICALAAFWLLRTPAWRIPIWFAAAAAALFALHPVSSCTVYPICSGRETLIPAIFVISSLACWLRGGRWYWPAILFLACALFSKEQSVVLPAIMLVADALNISRDAPRKNVARWAIRFLPVVSITAAYLLIRRSMFDERDEHRLAILEAPLRPFESVLFAVQSWFVPYVDLRYEPRWEIWFSEWRSVVAVVATALIIIAYFLVRGRSTDIKQLAENSEIEENAEVEKSDEVDKSLNPRAFGKFRHDGAVFAFWIAWVAFSLAPTANILNQEAKFAERYVFLAMLGPLAIAAIVMTRFAINSSRRNLVLSVAAVLILVCGAISFHRGAFYATDSAFLGQWLKVDPESRQARVTLGEHLFETGDISGAEKHFREILRVDLNDAAANHCLGYLLMTKGNRVEEALELLKHSVAQKADIPEAHNSLAIAHSRLRNFDEAERHYRIAIKLSPNYAEAYANLGQMYFDQGKTDLARASFQKAIEKNREFGKPHAGLALLDAIEGNLESAAAGFQRATELDPQLIEAFLNLGRVNMQLGKWDAARDAYERALELDPNSENARFNLNELNRR